jgi:hypothetical protein
MRTDSRRVRRLAAAAVAAAGFGVLADRALTQPPQPAAPAPAPEPTLLDPAAKDFATGYGLRPVAYIYGDVPVTRAELAEFLIARGGYEKVELLVNKKIIEREAARRSIAVTAQEMEVALDDDLRITTPPISRKDFVNVVLPKYGKTLYEWMEDVVRPRLLLSKMCRHKVQVTDADIQQAFERLYGEKRECQLLLYPKGDSPREINQIWDRVRKSAAEFDKEARKQANPALAANEGRITVSRHTQGTDKVMEQRAFGMEEGEVSGLFETSQGTCILKLVRKVPANTTVKLDARLKEQLHKEMFDTKLSEEIPKQFAELAKAANPNVLLNGPPSQWKFEQTNRAMIEDHVKQQGGMQPAGGSK